MAGKKLLVDVDTQQQLLFILDTRPPTLTQFERDIVNDKLAALQKFGGKSQMTQKQKDIIQSIYIKARTYAIPPLEPVPESTNPPR